MDIEYRKVVVTVVDIMVAFSRGDNLEMEDYNASLEVFYNLQKYRIKGNDNRDYPLMSIQAKCEDNLGRTEFEVAIPKDRVDISILSINERIMMNMIYSK